LITAVLLESVYLLALIGGGVVDSRLLEGLVLLHAPPAQRQNLLFSARGRLGPIEDKSNVGKYLLDGCGIVSPSCQPLSFPCSLVPLAMHTHAPLHCARSDPDRFFAMGLNELHFDKVDTHFISTLEHIDVSKDMTDEAVRNIVPMHLISENGIKGRGK